MASASTVGVRRKGSKGAKAAEGTSERLKVTGPENGRMTVVDFVKVFPISRPTLDKYRKEGMAGFPDDAIGGVEPWTLINAIMKRQSDAARPADEEDVKRAKEGKMVDDFRRSRIALQFMLGISIHVDDMKHFVSVLYNTLKASLGSWPRTLSQEVLQWMGSELRRKSKEDPAKRLERSQAVDVVLKMLNEREFGTKLDELLQARIVELERLQRDAIPNMIEMAKARGRRMTGMKEG